MFVNEPTSLIDPRDKIVLWTELDDLCDRLQWSSVGARRYYQLSWPTTVQSDTVYYRRMQKRLSWACYRNRLCRKRKMKLNSTWNASSGQSDAAASSHQLHQHAVNRERKCAENCNKWHNKFVLLNCNQLFGNFQTITVSECCLKKIDFTWKKIYLYFSTGNGQPITEPALCQLYRHTFVPDCIVRLIQTRDPPHDLRLSRAATNRTLLFVVRWWSRATRTQVSH